MYIYIHLIHKYGRRTLIRGNHRPKVSKLYVRFFFCEEEHGKCKQLRKIEETSLSYNTFWRFYNLDINDSENLSKIFHSHLPLMPYFGSHILVERTF